MTNAQHDALSPYLRAVLDELLARQAQLSTTSVPGVPTLPPSRDRGPGKSWPSPRLWRLAVRSGMAALAAAAVIFAVVLIVPRGAVVAPKWELAGELSGSFQQEDPGPLGYESASSLTCPNTTTCYMASGLGAVQMTHDGGKSWNCLPQYGTLFGGVVCASTSTCALLWAPLGRPPRFYFSWTTDGGRHWASAPAPGALSVAYVPMCSATDSSVCGAHFGPLALSCATASSCVIVASSPPPLLKSPWLPTVTVPKVTVRSVELVTQDSGRTWKKVSLPSRFWAGQVRCFVWGSCIATGEEGVTTTALYSDDGGIT
ncbi:MAG TPA: hypothetical protein VME46_13155 [Acidimicrobiales bacterium]|nr:hypothetical protein [Acidimicrobiales bacterium]